MKKNIYVAGLIIIIASGIFFDVMFGNYYNTPEEALKHSNNSVKSIVDTVWVEDKPVIFYISNNGDFCEAEFDGKEIFGVNGWRCSAVGTIHTNELDFNKVIPIREGTGKFSDNKPIVLFGITKSPKANTIKVQEQVPTFKSFEIEGENYVLWYIIIKLDEPGVDRVKITSD